jgi:hypothetical protein
MSITKLKTVGQWASLSNDLTQVGTHLGGRRVITGMLTGSDGLLASSGPVVVGAAGTRDHRRR